MSPFMFWFLFFSFTEGFVALVVVHIVDKYTAVSTTIKGDTE